MIQLLFLFLFAGATLFLLLVKIGPLRELVMRRLDQVKAGKGPATVKTVTGTMSVLLVSSFTSIVKRQNKGAKLGRGHQFGEAGVGEGVRVRNLSRTRYLQ